MEKLELKVQGKETAAEMSMTSPTDTVKLKAVEGFFGLFGGNIIESGTIEMESIPAKIEKELKKEVVKVAKPTEPHGPINPLNRPAAPKKLMLTREDENKEVVYQDQAEPFNPLADALLKVGVKPEVNEDLTIGGEPDYYRTGYKIKNGIKHFKCRYQCESCGNRGNHYIPDLHATVHCHECGHEQKTVRTSFENEFKTDQFNNWFVAGRQERVDEQIPRTMAEAEEQEDDYVPKSEYPGDFC